jgi:hypothetical protein
VKVVSKKKVGNISERDYLYFESCYCVYSDADVQFQQFKCTYLRLPFIIRKKMVRECNAHCNGYVILPVCQTLHRVVQRGNSGQTFVSLVDR